MPAHLRRTFAAIDDIPPDPQPSGSSGLRQLWAQKLTADYTRYINATSLQKEV